MLSIFYTVDVEVWCEGWNNIDEKFPSAFEAYIYGPTAKGRFGLPYQLELLQQYGLLGVFFIEPLFSTRFGLEPLAEIVGLVREAKQDVELHLHTEWVDESKWPLLEDVKGKRQHLKMFSLKDQTQLIAVGARLLEQAGALPIKAFRAGSFAFNKDTLGALVANSITFDSSYNASMFGADSGVMPNAALVEPVECDGVYEYPMTVYNDGTRALRHAQLTSCSWREFEGLLWQALERQRQAFVILSHNFELLNPSKNRPDDVVVRRFHQLCEFLDKNRDCFQTKGFRDLAVNTVDNQPEPLRSPLWKTGARTVEQLYRRRYS
jgi:hypothetical protein